MLFRKNKKYSPSNKDYNSVIPSLNQKKEPSPTPPTKQNVLNRARKTLKRLLILQFLKTKKNALIHAIKNGDPEIIELLLNKKPNLDLQDNDGNTALIHAAKNGDPAVIKLLLKHKPNLDLQDNDGNTALIHASENGHTETVKLLLNHKPNLNLKDNDVQTALIVAAENGHEDVVRAFLEAGADVIKTALIHAAKNGSREAVKALLKVIKLLPKEEIIDTDLSEHERKIK